MDKYGVDDKFLKSVTVLYVEDDPNVVDLVLMRFKDTFDKIVAVGNAEEALEIFKKEHFDLVLTDYFLPKMNGMEFTREVLTMSPNTPIILITGYVDMQFLVEAINLGITQFVAKPIQFKLLKNAIVNAVERVVIENLRRKTKEQELEILQYKEQYHSMQQELAFRKELHIIRNDLFMRYYDPGSKGFDMKGWNVSVFYESKDIVSGDSYTCRRLSDGSVLIFISDAMGKGVSASMTSILSVSIINYMIMLQTENGGFDLRKLVRQFTNFIKDNLLEDEVMCASVVHLDFEADKMSYALFAMPRMLIETASGEIKKIKSNNLPIMKFIDDIFIDTVDLKDASKMLIFSDGLIESETRDGIIYSEFIEEDFLSSPFLKIFEGRVKNRLEHFEDDTTVFFIRRPFAGVKREKKQEIATKLSSFEKLNDYLAPEFADFNVSSDSYECFFAAYTEAVMNAYEHGNLGVLFDEKHNLIENNLYDDELLKREENNDKLISLRYILCEDKKSSYIVVGVRDEGEGYPPSVFKNSIGSPTKFCGRGIKIIGHYTDAFFFSEDRREIFLVKVVDLNKSGF